tara:strand:- start:218 stop:805 length:588 start_codon:yes stop_codon:yes gene_type:complete
LPILKFYSQNINEKKWNSSSLDFIFLKLDFTSNLAIDKSRSNHVIIKYIQEGEFKEKVILKTTSNNRELYVHEVISPKVKTYNDKLSVHKTIANTIKVSIPIDLKTVIKTRSCDIKVMSSFSDIKIEIEEGKINLNQKKIKGKIKSISADIFCVNPFSKLFISSRFGDISGLDDFSSMPNLVIETIRGDVSKECF